LVRGKLALKRPLLVLALELELQREAQQVVRRRNVGDGELREVRHARAERLSRELAVFLLQRDQDCQVAVGNGDSPVADGFVGGGGRRGGDENQAREHGGEDAGHEFGSFRGGWAREGHSDGRSSQSIAVNIYPPHGASNGGEIVVVTEQNGMMQDNCSMM